MSNWIQPCDICGATKYKDLYFGNWLAYCDKCIEEGKRKNWEHDYDNTVKPALESGDFSDIDGELAESMAENL